MAVNFVPYTYADRATSNSYATVAEFTTYLNNYLNPPTFANDEAMQTVLIAGTKRLEAEKYLGSRSDSDAVLAHPRDGYPDKDGFSFSDGVIPEDVKNALFETAIYINSNDIVAPNDEANYTSAKVGEIEVSYKTTQVSITDTLNSAVWYWLSPFLDYSQSSSRVGR